MFFASCLTLVQGAVVSWLRSLCASVLAVTPRCVWGVPCAQENGSTPLVLACEGAKVPIAHTLLHAGADLHSTKVNRELSYLGGCREKLSRRRRLFGLQTASVELGACCGLPTSDCAPICACPVG